MNVIKNFLAFKAFPVLFITFNLYFFQKSCTRPKESLLSEADFRLQSSTCLRDVQRGGGEEMNSAETHQTGTFEEIHSPAAEIVLKEQFSRFSSFGGFLRTIFHTIFDFFFHNHS